MERNFSIIKPQNSLRCQNEFVCARRLHCKVNIFLPWHLYACSNVLRNPLSYGLEALSVNCGGQGREMQELAINGVHPARTWRWTMSDMHSCALNRMTMIRHQMSDRANMRRRPKMAQDAKCTIIWVPCVFRQRQRDEKE